VRIVLGLLRPDSGRVSLGPGLRIGYMPQRLTVADTLPLTVQRFVTLGTPASRARVQDALAEVGAAPVLDSPVQAISGGELQRVLLARALLRQPDLLVLDGGDCSLGIESTIVDCTRGAPALLRPGMLDSTTLQAALGAPLRGAGDDAPRASGTLEAHYAPDAKLRLMDGDMLRNALGILAGGPPPQGLAVYSRSVRQAPPGMVLRVMPDRAADVAHELFAVLRDFDAQGARLIWVETPPPGPAWDGVRDRLARAAAA
jgi:hypothetical protein